MPGRLTTLHIVGQGSAVLAAGAGQAGCTLLFFILSILSSFSAGHTEILWSRRYNSMVVVSYYRRRAC